MTKCIQRIRDLFEYALYKFTLYLLTYLLTISIILDGSKIEAGSLIQAERNEKAL